MVQKGVVRPTALAKFVVTRVVDLLNLAEQSRFNASLHPGKGSHKTAGVRTPELYSAPPGKTGQLFSFRRIFAGGHFHERVNPPFQAFAGLLKVMPSTVSR